MATIAYSLFRVRASWDTCPTPKPLRVPSKPSPKPPPPPRVPTIAHPLPSPAPSSTALLERDVMPLSSPIGKIILRNSLMYYLLLLISGKYLLGLDCIIIIQFE